MSTAHDPPGEMLELHIVGNATEADRVMHIGRPVNGIVEVREWTPGGVQGGPREYGATPEGLLVLVERMARSRRHMTADVYRLRLWLGIS